jgi:hypothetical protein
MNEVTRIRGHIPQEVFDYQVLLDALADYHKPRDKITRLLAEGTIIRIKKGLYCFGEGLRREPISREQLANLIYGPSYVSADYALGYHGLIPEHVETVTSVTTRRSRVFETPLGTFSYQTLSERCYGVGAALASVGRTTFLIATPEKALIDKVWTDKRFNGRRMSDFEAYLRDDLRIEDASLGGLDRSRLEAIRRACRSAKISNLVYYLLRGEGASDA